MRYGNVVALEIIVDVNLPVAVDDVIAALREVQALELEAVGLLGDLPQVGGKRLGLKIEIDENELAPGFAAQRHHAHGVAVEEFNAIDVGRPDEAAVEGVGPAVVLAAQDIFAAAAEGDGARPMAAHIAESAEFAFLVSDNDDWLAGNIHGEKTLRVGDRAPGSVYFAAGLMERPEELPGALENPRFFNFQNRGVGVETRREGLRALDLLVHIEV